MSFHFFRLPLEVILLLDITEWCESCKYREPADPHCLGCHNIYDKTDHNSAHWSRLYVCEYINMCNWMSSIGETNRLKLRHLHLRFTASMFTRYLDEGLFSGNFSNLVRCGGDLLGNALKLLSKGQNLQTLEISFDRLKRLGNEARIAFRILFDEHGKMRKDLEANGGLKQLEWTGESCSGEPDLLDLGYIYSMKVQSMENAGVTLREVREVWNQDTKPASM